MARGIGDKIPAKAKKVEMPKESKELLELRVLQNCLYFLSQANIQMGDPGKVYQAANALGEVYNFFVPRIKELAVKNKIDIKGVTVVKTKKESKNEKV